jgi:hypothetical protein
MTKRRLAISVVALCAFGASSARAVDARAMYALPVVVSLPGAKPLAFGTLRAFAQALKKAGHTCRLSPYEHGVDIACDGTPAESIFYLGMSYAPSRGPDMLQVDSLRAQGRNGGEAPVADWPRILGEFSGTQGKPHS